MEFFEHLTNVYIKTTSRKGPLCLWYFFRNSQVQNAHCPNITLPDLGAAVIVATIAHFPLGILPIILMYKIENKARWLVTIHDFQLFPVVFIIMTHKTQEAYQGVFGCVSRLLPNLQPVILSYFDTAMKNSAHAVWVLAGMIGFFFHYGQVIVIIVYFNIEWYHICTSDCNYKRGQVVHQLSNMVWLLKWRSVRCRCFLKSLLTQDKPKYKVWLTVRLQFTFCLVVHGETWIYSHAFINITTKFTWKGKIFIYVEFYK